MKPQELARLLIRRNYDLDLTKRFKESERNVLWQLLQDHFQGLDERGELLLPNLSAFESKDVRIFSDYAGDTSGNYLTYSFLICSHGAANFFQERAIEIQNEFQLGSRELNYKNFSRGRQKEALPEYLSAASQRLNGYLFTLGIEKRIPSLFAAPTSPSDYVMQLLRENDITNLNKKNSEKFLRITHTIAFLLKLLLENPQAALWVTDNDDICANPTLQNNTVEFLNRLISTWQAKVTRLYFSTQKDFPLDGIERLLALPDIAAGGFAEALNLGSKTALETPPWKDGSGWVCDWFGRQGLALKQSNLLIYDAGKGQLGCRSHQFKVEPKPEWPNGTVQLPNSI